MKFMDDKSQKFTKNTIQANVNSKSIGKEKIPSGTEYPVNEKPQKVSAEGNIGTSTLYIKLLRKQFSLMNKVINLDPASTSKSVATGSLDIARKKVIQPGSSPLPQIKPVKNAFSTKPPLHTETEVEKTTHHFNEGNDDDWKVIKNKRHNKKLPTLNRPQPLKGTNNEKQHLLKIARRMSTLFVSGLAPEMGANSLAEYLKEKQLYEGCTCEKMKTKKDNHRSSFKLTVHFNSRDKYMIQIYGGYNCKPFSECPEPLKFGDRADSLKVLHSNVHSICNKLDEASLVNDHIDIIVLTEH
ncbi:hypothetical protein HHI36_005775 [Cryptolaemus montrouzieri]|uniref:Uncharacterized protein n=1 Tax=Cryptolaemus montrouzieri TaxID=559131 RepID=A0ABD2NVD0_9CUCU